ncbi:MAG: tetratricopeptide repeat protein [Bacteroidetes bacterium]|nr:tetratricopeptide repeat protein [Bacteroidota bacterium]
MKIIYTRFLFGIILLLAGFGYAQNTDSLKQVLKTTKNDTLRIQLMRWIGENEGIFRVSYWDTLRRVCEEMIPKAASPKEKFFYQQNLANAINNMGYVSDEKGITTDALEYYKKSLAIYAEIHDSLGLGIEFMNIGALYEEQGNIPSALENYQRSLRIREAAGDIRGTGLCYNNIGMIYFKQKDDEKALKYFNRSLYLLKKANADHIISVIYGNIGLIYKNRGDYAYATYYIEKARQLQLKSQDLYYASQSTGNIGSLYENRQQYDLALQFYNEQLRLSELLNFKKGIAAALSNLASVNMKIGKLKEAEAETKQSLAYFQELGFPEFISGSSSLLSQIYQKEGNYKGAYDMHVLYMQMKDSINRTENKKASIQRELQYDYEKKTSADSLKAETANKITAIKFRQEKTQRYTLYAGIALLLLVAVFIFNRLQVTRRQNLIIENQKMEVELKNEEISHQKELVEEKQKEIIDSITYARRIQHAVLTGDDVWKKISRDYFILFLPKDIVSGDFYWAYNTPNGRSVFVLADCTGHGVPGGFMSMLGNSFLNEIVVENKIFKGDEILNKLRAKIIAALEQKGQTEQKDGMDMALCVWNKMDNSLEFAGANNPLWLLRDGQITEYKADKMPIGTYTDNLRPFSSTSISLQKGDLIYLSTDGYADQFGGPSGKKLKYKALLNLLLSNSALPMDEQKNRLDKAFSDWKGNHDQIDDVSLIGIRV